MFRQLPTDLMRRDRRSPNSSSHVPDASQLKKKKKKTPPPTGRHLRAAWLQQINPRSPALMHSQDIGRACAITRRPCVDLDGHADDRHSIRAPSLDSAPRGQAGSRQVESESAHRRQRRSDRPMFDVQIKAHSRIHTPLFKMLERWRCYNAIKADPGAGLGARVRSFAGKGGGELRAGEADHPLAHDLGTVDQQ